jgi:RimJ/RimL family protein N-acetyltransferase
MPWVTEEPLAREARIELLERWRREWEAGGDVVVGLFLGTLAVGGGGLHRRIGPGALEIGYWVHVDHVGRGYASEAASTLTTLAFTVPGIDRVEIHHDRANTASGAVPQRLGFAWAGESIDEVTAPGECGVEVRWSMTRDVWCARPPPASA